MIEYDAEMLELNVPYTSAFAFGRKISAPVTRGLDPYTQRQSDAILTDTASRYNFMALYSMSTVLSTVFGAVALSTCHGLPVLVRGIGLAACAFSGASSMGLSARYGWLPRGRYPQDVLEEIYHRR